EMNQIVDQAASIGPERLRRSEDLTAVRPALHIHRAWREAGGETRALLERARDALAALRAE
ncbi:MAG: hypothetical protein ACWGNS_13720, partial [Burkholderiales bacterium]